MAAYQDNSVRLIPAGAGSTTETVLEIVAAVAHPRRRGEHYARVVDADPCPGSSPLARGARNSARGVSRMPLAMHRQGLA